MEYCVYLINYIDRRKNERKIEYTTEELINEFIDIGVKSLHIIIDGRNIECYNFKGVIFNNTIYKNIYKLIITNEMIRNLDIITPIPINIYYKKSENSLTNDIKKICNVMDKYFQFLNKYKNFNSIYKSNKTNEYELKYYFKKKFIINNIKKIMKIKKIIMII